MNNFPVDTFACYANFLEKRILDAQHLTEDSVRYSFFFAALQTTDIMQHEIILELPHPAFPGKEVDTYVLSVQDRPPIYIEFKFHRKRNSTAPKPQNAGGLFKDFSRLASIKRSKLIDSKNSICLIVYLTDRDMAAYFDKHAEMYSNFWAYEAGESFVYDESFVVKTTDTFKKASGEIHASMVNVLYKKALANDYHMRIYEIE